MSSLASGFELVDAPDAEFDLVEARWTPLVAEARRLVDLTVRSEVGDADVEAALAAVRSANAMLEQRVRPGAAGVRFTSSGRASKRARCLH